MPNSHDTVNDTTAITALRAHARKELINKLKSMGIDIDCTVVDNAVEAAIPTLRNELIRREYRMRIQLGEKREAVMQILADKHNLSRYTIRSITHGKR